MGPFWQRTARLVAPSNKAASSQPLRVVVTRKSAELMGGWLNNEQSCQAERRLRVNIEFTRFRLDGSHGASVVDRVTRRVTNCAEGGPTLGFQYRASDFSQGFGCADGR
jgi:hypothetical protein